MNEATHLSPSALRRGSRKYDPRPTGPGEFQSDLSEVVATVGSWLTAILAAALGVWTTEHTSYHQLAIAILTSLVTLAVALGVLDVLWRIGAHLTRTPDRR
jgi:hypothetical protein